MKCLETGEEIAIDADKQMDTMPVIKIPLMVEAFRQMEAGKFALTDHYTLKESDKRPGTGVIRSLNAGAVLTIKDLLTHKEGAHPFGLSSAHDIGVLLEMLEHGEAVSPKASDAMLTGVRLPHKTGDFLPYIGNHVGVLEMPGRTIVISVFTAHHYGAGTYLEDAIARIGEQVANYYGYRQ